MDDRWDVARDFAVQGSRFNSSRFPRPVTRVGDTLFFAANDGIHGDELWKSDGTVAGTMMVKDIRAGINGSGIRNLVGIGDTFYFAVNDGVNGNELWEK
ncbi:MAG: hypothetical protein R3C05_08700 [Pirellulaceae bacterium]